MKKKRVKWTYGGLRSIVQMILEGKMLVMAKLVTLWQTFARMMSIFKILC